MANEVKFDVTGDELRKHCAVKAEYHAGRAAFYAEQEKNFSNEVDELSKKHENMYSNTTAMSNRDRMEQSKCHHQDRSRFFKFAVDHLRQEKYQITKAEATDFELIPR